MAQYPALTGLIAAPFTAFQGDGSLNLNLIEKQAASLKASGVSGAFVCGTTGEGLSLTTAERMQVAERWMEAAPRELRVIVQVGHNALGDSETLARHAQKIGAAAIGAFAPSFFKPATVGDLVIFCAGIAANAPQLPFYYYHIPSMTGVNFPCADFLAQARDRIPNLAGVKFTFESLMDYLACLRLDDGRYNILFGRDEMLLAALALGARGAIGTTYNIAAPIFRRIIEAFDHGDLIQARVEQARANAMIAAIGRHGGVAAAKAVMPMIGLNCGPVRSPLHTLDEAEKRALRQDLESSGFFHFCSKL